MGLNEYAVLNQVWAGNIHAPQIAQATNFHPQLVKACLISLERAHILEYKEGYKPATGKPVKSKVKLRHANPPKSVAAKPRKTRKTPMHIKIYESIKRGNNTNALICADLNVDLTKIAPAMSVLRKDGMLATILTGTRFKRYEAI
jgi:hypothetical protein